MNQKLAWFLLGALLGVHVLGDCCDWAERAVAANLLWICWSLTTPLLLLAQSRHPGVSPWVGTGLVRKMPKDIYSVAFWQAYRAAIGQSDDSIKRTFSDLISAYRLSPEFRGKAIATQHDYERYLKILDETWGPLLVSGVRPRHVLKLRDAWATAPASANMLVSIARLLINWGVPREFSDTESMPWHPQDPNRIRGWRTALARLGLRSDRDPCG